MQNSKLNVVVEWMPFDKICAKLDRLDISSGNVEIVESEHVVLAYDRVGALTHDVMKFDWYNCREIKHDDYILVAVESSRIPSVGTSAVIILHATHIIFHNPCDMKLWTETRP
jgi:hypothetical protein